MIKVNDTSLNGVNEAKPIGKTSHRENWVSDDFDLMSDEYPLVEVRVRGVFGAIKRGLTKTETLDKYKQSEEYYDEDLRRVLNS